MILGKEMVRLWRLGRWRDNSGRGDEKMMMEQLLLDGEIERWCWKGKGEILVGKVMGA